MWVWLTLGRVWLFLSACARLNILCRVKSFTLGWRDAETPYICSTKRTVRLCCEANESRSEQHRSHQTINRARYSQINSSFCAQIKSITSILTFLHYSDVSLHRRSGCSLYRPPTGGNKEYIMFESSKRWAGLLIWCFNDDLSYKLRDTMSQRWNYTNHSSKTANTRRLKGQKLNTMLSFYNKISWKNRPKVGFFLG